MVEVKNLSKKYTRRLVLDDMSFQLKQGDIVGFLGPNGAGKSTTMNILSGYTSLTAGHISIAGVNLLEQPLQVRKNIGYLPENPPLYDEMLVDEYLRFVAQLKKIPQEQAEEEREKLYVALDLSDVRDRLIKNLSKGYRQRIGIAQAFCGSPQLIILDEPTSGLDPKQVLDFRRFILQHKGLKTFIISSHILSELENICDHILVINEGKIVASSPTSEIAQILESTQTIQLSIRCDESAQVLEELSGIAGVQRIEFVGPGQQQGILKFSIQVHPSQDPREAMFYKLAQLQWPIFSLTSTQAGLEEVFLRLTKS